MSVRPYRRVVLMGGVGMLGGPGLDLHYEWVMRKRITIHGQWMYPPEATIRLAGLIRSGLLDLSNFEVTTFGVEDVNEAVAHAAANTSPLRMTVIQP
jgi:alcohol dehydrogenase